MSEELPATVKEILDKLREDLQQELIKTWVPDQESLDRFARSVAIGAYPQLADLPTDSWTAVGTLEEDGQFEAKVSVRIVPSSQFIDVKFVQ